MAKHDDDLISALAEGTLDEAHAADVEAAISRDPAAAKVLADHRRALALVRGAPAVTMTEEERATLHAAITTALNIDPGTVDPQVARPSRRRLAWPVLVTSAAVLVAVIAAVPIFGLLTPGSTDSAESGALQPPPQQVPLGESDGVDDGTGDLDSLLNFSGDSLAEGSPTLSSDQQTVESTIIDSTTPEEGDGPGRTVAWNVTDDESLTLRHLLVELEQSELLETAAQAAPDSECLDEAVDTIDADDDSLWVYTFTPEEGEPLLVYFDRTEDGEVGHILVLELTGCTEAAASR